MAQYLFQQLPLPIYTILDIVLQIREHVFEDEHAAKRLKTSNHGGCCSKF